MLIMVQVVVEISISLKITVIERTTGSHVVIMFYFIQTFFIMILAFYMHMEITIIIANMMWLMFRMRPMFFIAL